MKFKFKKKIIIDRNDGNDPNRKIYYLLDNNLSLHKRVKNGRKDVFRTCLKYLKKTNSNWSIIYKRKCDIILILVTDKKKIRGSYKYRVRSARRCIM